MEVIKIYTDGSCFNSDRFGKKAWLAGAGIVFKYMNIEKRSKVCIGKGTNNVGELYAIKYALDSIKPEHANKPIKIYTDSKYCIGSITENWKSKKNINLINSIKRAIKFKGMNNLEFIWVKGHSGHLFNELADTLASEGRELGGTGNVHESLYNGKELIAEREIKLDFKDLFER